MAVRYARRHPETGEKPRFSGPGQGSQTLYGGAPKTAPYLGFLGAGRCRFDRESPPIPRVFGEMAPGERVAVMSRRGNDLGRRRPIRRFTSRAVHVMGVNETTPLLTTAQAADLLGVSPRTMEDWRRWERGPAYIRLGYKVVRYRLPDLESFVSAGAVAA